MVSPTRHTHFAPKSCRSCLCSSQEGIARLQTRVGFGTCHRSHPGTSGTCDGSLPLRSCKQGPEGSQHPTFRPVAARQAMKSVGSSSQSDLYLLYRILHWISFLLAKLAGEFLSCEYRQIRRDPTSVGSLRLAQANCYHEYFQQCSRTITDNESLLSSLWNVAT